MRKTYSLFRKKIENRFFYFLLICSINHLTVAQTCPAPADFNLLTPCYVNGSRTASPNDDVIVLFNHATARGTSATKQVVASYSEVGTVWGLAWHAQSKKLYAAAFLKRHCDLSPDGLGAIYEIDLTTPTTAGAGTPTLWMNLNSTTHLGAGATLFPTETAANRGLGAIGQPSHDVWAYTRVGKQGLGDIEISADGTKMYVMDLTNRQVLEINIGTKTVTNRYAVNAPANYTNAADRRPFGIKHYNGELYIGVVSSGETDGKKKDVRANVMKLSGSSFINVYEVDSMAVEPPDHIGEENWVTSYRGNPNFGTGLGWNKYSDAVMTGNNPNNPYDYIQNPVPLVSDIEFDNAGNMVIGIMDWSGHRMGAFNYRADPAFTTLHNIQSHGDIIRAMKSGSTWVKENGVGDFYNDMKSVPDQPGWQDDTFKGGMIISDCNGTELIVGNMQDPFTLNEGGSVWMKTGDGLMQTNNTGSRVTGSAGGMTIAEGSRIRIYLSQDAQPSTFGKAAGLGDIVGTFSVACIKPVATVSPKTQTICIGSTATAFTASPGTGVEYKWYGPLVDTTGSLGTAIAGQTIASYTPTGTSITTAGTKYYAVVVNTTGDLTCADTAFVQLVVNAKPVIADGTAAICAGETVDLTSKITNYNTLLNRVWTVATAGGTAVTTPTAVQPAATTTYVLVAENAAGCKDTANVAVTVNAKPNAGTDKSLACADPMAGTLQTTTTLTGFSPAGGTWAAQTGNPATAAVTNAGAVTGMTVAGTYKFIYTVSDCSDTVAVTVEPCSGCVKPNAGNDQSICAPTVTATLTGFAPAGGTWAAQTGNPATAAVTNAGAVTGMTANGTYKFIYSVVAGGQTCTDTVQIIRNEKPTVGDASICAPATTASVTRTPAGGTWVADAANPAAATISAAGAVSGLTANGTYKFIYTLNGCSDTATVVRNAKPNAGTDKSLACADPVAGTLQTTTTLTGFSPAGGTWAAQTGNPATAAVTNAGTVTGMTVAGTYKFIYTLNTCSDTVAVTVEPCSGCVKPNAGNDQSICAPTVTATLTGFAPAGGTWAAQTGNPATAAVTNAGAVTGMTANGTYKFIYSVVAGGQTCTDTVQIIRNEKPTVGDASICAPATTASVTRTPAGGTWVADAANPAAATISAAGAVSGLTANGTYKFIYTLNGCSDTATVVRNAKPNAGADQTLACANPATNTLTTTTTLVPVTTGGTFTQIGTTPAVATISGNAVSGMTIAGTYQFQYNAAGCLDTVAVTVSPCAGCVKPNAGPDVTLTCPPTGISPSTATLVPVTTGGTWAAQTGNPANTAITGNTVTGLTSAGTYKFIYSVTGGGQICTDTVQVIVPTCVQPKGSLGDFVWKDTNNNGIQDETTPNGGGVAGVQVELYKVGTTAAIAKDTTDATGKYLFSNLDAGQYYIKVLAATLPAGCTISTMKDVNTGGGTEANDSDVDPTTGQSGNYTIDPTDPTKKDILTVDAALYSPCVKPNAGPDQTLACGTTAPSTANLVDAASGQKWKVLSVQPNTTVTVTTPAGDVTGMTAPGTYRFVLQTQSDSLACRDTVSITVPNCTCPTINILTTNATVCKDSLFPTLTVAVLGSNIQGVGVAWFANATGGTALSTALSFKPAGTATVTDTFYVALTGASANCLTLPRTPVIVTVQNCAVEIDLALKKMINKKIAQIGDELTYTIKVFNQLNVAATGVEVTDSIATTVQFVAGSFVASRGNATITGNVIKWTIGGIAANAGANGDTVTLTYKVKATMEGVHFNTAEICKTNEKDVDSTPCNHNDNEDDIDRQCFTVPIKLCPSEKVQARVSNIYTNVQWYKNGGSTPIASGNEVMLSDIGVYTYTATNQTCPAEGCCPIIIEAGVNCCPVEVCVPFTVKKKKK